MGKKVKDAGGMKLEDIDDDDDSDTEEIDSKELSVLNNILNVKQKSPKEYSTLKYVLYGTAIFFVLSLPFLDRVFELALPLANSWLILLGLKTIIFFIVFYIVFYMNTK